MPISLLASIRMLSRIGQDDQAIGHLGFISLPWPRDVNRVHVDLLLVSEGHAYHHRVRIGARLPQLTREPVIQPGPILFIPITAPHDGSLRSE